MKQFLCYDYRLSGRQPIKPTHFARLAKDRELIFDAINFIQRSFRRGSRADRSERKYYFKRRRHRPPAETEQSDLIFLIPIFARRVIEETEYFAGGAGQMTRMKKMSPIHD